jgi:hypothetical protein
MYKSLLTERLLNYKSDFILEQEVLKMFASHKDDPTLYAKMKYQIADAIISRKHEETYKSINVRQSSEKYKEFDLSTFDKNICKFMIMRSFIVDQKDVEQYDVPDVIAVFMAIFMGYFKGQFKDQTLAFLHNHSTGILTMKLKDDHEFNIKMTLPQMYVIITISRASVISAKGISESLKIPLKILGRVLNSLLDCNLVTRGQGPASDASVPFSINWNCTFDESDIDIIPALKKFTNPSVSQANQVSQASQVPDVSSALLNSKILTSVQTTVTMGVQVLTEIDIRTADESSLTVNVSDAQYSSEMKHHVDSNKLENNQ